MSKINMEEYYLNLALSHFNNSFIKVKDEAAADKYFKCWVNDAFYVLYDYGINIETFLIKLKQQQHEKESVRNQRDHKRL